MADAGGAWANAAVAYSGARKQRKETRNMYNDQMRRQDAQQARLAPQRDFYEQSSRRALGPALNYYTQSLNNPQQALAPELNALAARNRGSFQNARSLFGRGGGGSDPMQFQTLGQQTNLRMQAKESAAGNLASMGDNFVRNYLGTEGMETSANQNRYNNGMDMMNQNFRTDQQFGNAFSQALQGSGQAAQNWWGNRQTQEVLPTRGYGFGIGTFGGSKSARPINQPGPSPLGGYGGQNPYPNGFYLSGRSPERF